MHVPCYNGAGKENLLYKNLFALSFFLLLSSSIMNIRFAMVQKKKILITMRVVLDCLLGSFAHDNKIKIMNTMSTRNLNDAVTTQGEDRYAIFFIRDNVN